MQFSFTRFYYLIVKQWKENKKVYVLGLTALPLLMGVTYLLFAYTTELSENNQVGIFCFGMIIFGGIFCSTLLSDYTPKPKGIRSLILPALAIEKLLVAIVYGLIIFPILYVLLVYPVLVLANYIDYVFFGNLNTLIEVDFKDFIGMLSFTFTILSFVLLCSLFYRKFIFIKASLTLLTLIFFVYLSSNLINKVVIGNSQPLTFKKEFLEASKISINDAKKANFELMESGPFSDLAFNSGLPGSNDYISPSEPIGIISLIIYILIAPVVLIACYHRLKETEL